MQQETRVRNASRNVVFGMFLKGYQILLPFIMRTAIMYYMGISRLEQLVWFSAVGVEPCGAGRWFGDGVFHVPADH